MLPPTVLNWLIRLLHSSQSILLYALLSSIGKPLCLFILEVKLEAVRIKYASRNTKYSKTFDEYFSSAFHLLRRSFVLSTISSPSTAYFRTLLFLPVNPIKEIRVAISISSPSRFQWKSWLTSRCNCCLFLYIFSKFLENLSRSIHNFNNRNPSIIFGWGGIMPKITIQPGNSKIPQCII